MSTRRKVLLFLAVWLGGTAILAVALGKGPKNNSFKIQNEFKLTDWVHLGVFSINRAVVYLLIATILTVVTMVWISRRMQARPNKVQTAVEVLYDLMRTRIAGGASSANAPCPRSRATRSVILATSRSAAPDARVDQ